MTGIVHLRLREVGGIQVLRAAGEIDGSVIPLVREQLDGAALDGGPGFVLDLSELRFLDSTGLNLMIDAANRLKEAGQELHIVTREGSHVGRLLRTTRVDEVVAVHPTLTDAIEALAPRP